MYIQIHLVLGVRVVQSPWILELQAFVNHLPYVLQSFGTAESALNSWAISPSPL